jgi:Flp pilus assembly protein TadG
MNNRTYLFYDSRSMVVMRSVRERGSTLVEFAFVIITFMTFLFGIIGFGHALYTYHFLNHEAKEATRWAAVNGYTCGAPPLGDNSCNGTAPMNNGSASATDIDTYVRSHVPTGIKGAVGADAASTPLVVNVAWTAPSGSPPICTAVTRGVGPFSNYPGCTVSVTVSYAFHFILPLLPTSTTVTAPCTATGFCFSSRSTMVIAH